MKVTLSWLKDHLDTDETVGKLAEKLTMTAYVTARSSGLLIGPSELPRDA